MFFNVGICMLISYVIGLLTPVLVLGIYGICYVIKDRRKR